MFKTLFTASFFCHLLGVCLLAPGIAAPPLFQAEAHTPAGQSAREGAQSTTIPRIMPLGNSITQSYPAYNSYRRPLWHKLKNAGYVVDFVGSLRNNYNGPPANPDFDLDHEGHSGWRADQLLAGVGTWASTYRPDVVLMHAGSNDMLQSQSVSSTLEELSQIIDRIRAANPYVTILLAKIIPASEWNGRVARIQAFNDAIPGLVARKHTAQSAVILVDQSSGFYPASDTFDGIHPNASGENKMAARWYDALIRILPKPSTDSFPGHYQLLARHSSKALDVAQSSTADGAKIQQWTGHSGANQQWSLQSTGDGYYKLIARHSGKALTLGSTSSATRQSGYQGYDGQKWKVEALGNGYYKITSKAGGRALDVDRAYTHDGAIVLVWTYTGAYNQQWRLRSLSTTGRQLVEEAEPSHRAEEGIRLFPNPVAGRTTLAFQSAVPQAVKILLIDASGRVVITLSPHAHAGENHVPLDFSERSPGLYTLQLHLGNQVLTRKLAVGE
jgi:lysophospholipase L1-like esterase